MTDELSLEVEIETIRSVVQIALDELQEASGPTVKLTSDYFWSIPIGDRVDIESEPPELTVGQVSEVIQNLSSLESEPETISFYHLQWIAELLTSVVSNRNITSE